MKWFPKNLSTIIQPDITEIRGNFWGINNYVSAFVNKLNLMIPQCQKTHVDTQLMHFPIN